MAKGFYDFLFEFSSALGADEVSRFVDRFRRRGASGTTPAQTSRPAARTGDIDDAYFDLKKTGAPVAKSQEIRTWIKNLKRTPEGRAGIRRIERDKTTDKIRNMYEQGTEDERNDAIPPSWQQRINDFLPTLDPSTQDQIHKTLGVAARRQERQAAALKSLRKSWVAITIYIIIVVLALIIFLPDLRHIFTNLFNT